jgi:hypothetical protein
MADWLALIDWWTVLWGAVWVAGLAVALAAVSRADYEAAQAKTRTREVLRQARYQTAVWGGLALFALGQGGLAGGWWLRVAWLVVGAGLGAVAWRAWRGGRGGGGLDDSGGE